MVKFKLQNWITFISVYIHISLLRLWMLNAYQNADVWCVIPGNVINMEQQQVRSQWGINVDRFTTLVILRPYPSEQSHHRTPPQRLGSIGGVRFSPYGPNCPHKFTIIFPCSPSQTWLSLDSISCGQPCADNFLNCFIRKMWFGRCASASQSTNVGVSEVEYTI